MRIYELRTYHMRSREELETYATEFYPKHLVSFPMFDIGCHGLWSDADPSKNILHVLVSYPKGSDPAVIGKAYMSSEVFRDELDGMDLEAILKVESTFMTPSAGSPLL